MKRAIFLIAVLIVSLAARADDVAFNEHTLEIHKDRDVPRIVGMTSQVYQLAGSPEELVRRAQACVARYVSNDEVSTSGSSAAGFFGSIAGQGHNVNSAVAGGALIELTDPANGLLVANSRADYKFMLLAHSVRSKLSLEAKEGRFRFVHTNIESLQKNTGSMRNDGYSQIIQRRGTGWDKALEAVAAVETKIAGCMAESNADDW